ncbi:hypothetical protein [Paenibacillus elgii]|uniref:hypothetical protein n=1 Tax=Paenibacillus elgii TaxID=189691 RepID=UPI0004923CE1|nr:hypothetical protein [Paenibacillus elgii]
MTTKLARGINPETGEIGTFVPDGEGYVIRSEEQREAGRKYFERERRIDFGRRVDFTFTAMEAIGEVISVLTTAQCGFLTVLQCYVSYDTNTLVNADRTPMTTTDMLEALKLGRKRSTFYNFLAACTANSIITEESDGSYTVNPRYHFRGQARDVNVIRTYTAKIKQTYKDAKQAADLGLIYRMLPFVNYEINALCSNPTERDPRKIEWFNRKELATAVGISEAELTKRIRRLTVGNEYVIARIAVGGETKYMFNPHVFKRNKRQLNDTEQAMFNVKYRG